MPSPRRATRPDAPATPPAPVVGTATPRPRIAMRRRSGLEALAVLGLVASVAIVPVASAQAQDLPSSVTDLESQSLVVSAAADEPVIARPDATASDGVESLVASGTNADWATLVLLDGDFPITQENVTVFLRWMRQENGPDDWFNRNNPLNNGYGSGGGGGTGVYSELQTAAQKAAENLRRPIFSDIAAAFDAKQSADATARVIWASRWSTSHYANGHHWSTAPVKIVTAPAGAWH
ncbi:hypothetical protein QT381_00985 [Galbitalea sp. SE-J8]|uniref:hypothetical protein n=1 Tax=Galbitalea sp. SE-J8 TaxID=3054952 RepID=UPI00259D1B9A|nr:hypothetical protein [Galbitalea sp. SE-J8]MDM4761583.1 hypothetical protein [Galbitalea sp. SE-J8]